MVIRILVVLAGILFSLTALSQGINGTVKDSTGKAVSYAIINLRKKAGNAVIAYTTTDTKGAYQLEFTFNLPADSLYIEARCIGYKTQSKSLKDLPTEIDFVLAVSVNELQSVIVKNSRPVLRTNGDTLSYKAAQFSNPQDRVIG
ncbi:MAG TPA: carboxypeptidase-like regulatory domain-containing protein, partial [Niastella sp.]